MELFLVQVKASTSWNYNNVSSLLLLNTLLIKYVSDFDLRDQRNQIKFLIISLFAVKSNMLMPLPRLD